jgi:hypothetical protein
MQFYLGEEIAISAEVCLVFLRKMLSFITKDKTLNKSKKANNS